MKVVCAFLLACVGISLAQPTAHPLAQCSPKSFKALTFDAVGFEPSFSYHNIDDSLTLYKYINDDTVHLYDFASGKLYVQDKDGKCHYYQSASGQVTQQDLPDLTGQISQGFTFTDNAGVTSYGLELSRGAFVIRAVVAANCNTNFLSFVVDGKVRVANFFTNQEDLSDDGKTSTKDYKAAFEAADCSLRSLDD